MAKTYHLTLYSKDTWYCTEYTTLSPYWWFDLQKVISNSKRDRDKILSDHNELDKSFERRVISYNDHKNWFEKPKVVKRNVI